MSPSPKSDVEPVEIRAPEGARMMEVDWSDGTTSLLPHRILRGFCPCALCQGHHGPIAWVGGDGLSDEALGLKGIELSGQYAVLLRWADGHATGIYRFAFLRTLGELYGQADDAIRAAAFSHDH
ncbi:MAG: DUF971 domain-containing protein [Myxococcales bacterium]|nr:DUF971 domain-containing protein [Myxococcales bacterium]